MSLNEYMAWTYSNWITKTGDDRKSTLELHIQEVTDAISSNRTTAGRSLMTDPNVNYLKELNQKYALLGGFAPRANGRSRMVRFNQLEPQGID